MQMSIRVRAKMTNSQAEQLQQRLSSLAFQVYYEEERHGPALGVFIACTPAQQMIVE